MLYDLKKELSKAVAVVLHEMLRDVVQQMLEEGSLLKNMVEELSEELLQPDFPQAVQDELLELLEEKNIQQ